MHKFGLQPGGFHSCQANPVLKVSKVYIEVCKKLCSIMKPPIVSVCMMITNGSHI